METTVSLISGAFGKTRAYVVNGPDIKAENTFKTPDNVLTKDSELPAEGRTLEYSFEPHSITALVCDIS